MTRKTKSIRVRVTESEHEAIEALASAAGLGISDFLRRLALGDAAETDGRVARRLKREAKDKP